MGAVHYFARDVLRPPRSNFLKSRHKARSPPKTVALASSRQGREENGGVEPTFPRRVLSERKWKFGLNARPINERVAAKYSHCPRENFGDTKSAQLFTDFERALPSGKVLGWLRSEIWFREEWIREALDVSRWRGGRKEGGGLRRRKEDPGTKGLSVERLARPIARCHTTEPSPLFNLDRFQRPSFKGSTVYRWIHRLSISR